MSERATLPDTNVVVTRMGGMNCNWKRRCRKIVCLLYDINFSFTLPRSFFLFVENRIDACICLFNLVKEEVCREILEPLSRQLLLSPDSYIRSLMADALCLKDNSCCAVTEEHLIDHLVTRFPALEVNKKIISQDDRCFIKKAVFRGREAVVKVMYVTNQNVRGRMPSDCQQANRRFIREAHFLSRIQKHPNFPTLLSYNTETLPYHLITEYESQGNLLQLLQRTHDPHSRLEETLLLQMLINIADALQYLAKLHLVHRSVMAKNVLVGDDNVCKLSGLHSLRSIDWGPLTEGRLKSRLKSRLTISH